MIGTRILRTSLFVLGIGLSMVPAIILGPTAAQAKSCDFSGTWLIKVVVPVEWPKTIMLEQGAGDVTLWFKSQRVQADNVLLDSPKLCGISVPDWVTRTPRGNETTRYGVMFPRSLFTYGYSTTAPLTTLIAASEPGAKFFSGPLAVTMGVDLPNPATDSWPDRRSSFPDVDGDLNGRSGVTVVPKQGPSYSMFPVNLIRPIYADKANIALRVATAHSGGVSSCDEFSGDAVIPLISGVPALNSVVLGCSVYGGQNCSPAQADAADHWRPRYRPAGIGQFAMKRIYSSATCDEIRNF